MRVKSQRYDEVEQKLRDLQKETEGAKTKVDLVENHKRMIEGSKEELMKVNETLRREIDILN